MTDTSGQLLALLRRRHSGEVFVAECKAGPVGSRIMDGFALLPTWSPMTAIGYEVKVTRSDWLRDQKLHAYLPCCHQFYVVASKGIVQAGELPDGVGLMEPIGRGTGRRLVVRVKATRREADPQALSRVLAYALLWRVPTIDGTHAVQHFERRESLWKAFVEGRAETRSIGRSVGPKMRAELKRMQERVEAAERLADQLSTADGVLRELGIDSSDAVWNLRGEVIRKVAALKSDGVIDALQRAQSGLQAALSALQVEAR